MWIFAAQSGAWRPSGRPRVGTARPDPDGRRDRRRAVRTTHAGSRHHEYPASEDQQLCPARGLQPGCELGDGVRRNAGNPAQPFRVVHEASTAHGDALGEAEVHRPQEPREVAPDAVEIRGVASRAASSFGPTRARGIVAQTRTSPSRSTSMQKACCTLPDRTGRGRCERPRCGRRDPSPRSSGPSAPRGRSLRGEDRGPRAIALDASWKNGSS